MTYYHCRKRLRIDKLGLAASCGHFYLSGFAAVYWLLAV
jgi:hypothetical protein